MTSEQIAALRALAEDGLLDHPLHGPSPDTMIALLDHIANLEAERDAVLEEAAQLCLLQPALVKRIRALKSAPASAKEA